MPLTPQYKHPPVTEAIITLSFREAIPFTAIEKACPDKVFDGRYKMQHGLMAVTIGLLKDETDDPVEETKIRSGMDGLQLRSDAGDVLDINTTNISLHLLRPYKGWNYLVQETKQVWQKLQGCIPEIAVSEITTRYINELRMPEGANKELTKWVEVVPKPLRDVKGKMQQFFIQMQLKNEDGRLRGVFTETIQPSNAPAGFSVILDISVSILEQQAITFEHYNELMPQIRAYKNELFEGAITEAMAQSFEEPL